MSPVERGLISMSQTKVAAMLAVGVFEKQICQRDLYQLR
jgi:hypothetical protein